MEKTLRSLYEFVERAQKSRKYPENTAQGLKVALKLFESVTNEEEKSSLDLFKKNLDQIYHDVTVKNGKDFSASTLSVYKSRVEKVIRDYEKYGIDPTKMASWSPKVVKRKPRKKMEKKSDATQQGESDEIIPEASVGMHKLELSLRSGAKSIILVPKDMTSQEVEMFKSLLDSLVVKD